MPVHSFSLEQALSRVNISDDAPCTMGFPVTLSAQNYHAQMAAGGALDVTTAFTQYNQSTQAPTRRPQIVLGGGGANPVLYTLYGTSIFDDSAISEVITAAGAGTYQATLAYETITRLTSNIDPLGTTDLQAYDTWVYPAARRLIVGVAGDVNGQQQDDSADVVLPLPACMLKLRHKIVRVTNTTATGLVLAY